MLKGVLCILVIGICGYIGSLLSKKYALRQDLTSEMLHAAAGIKNRILRKEILSCAIEKEAKGLVEPMLKNIAAMLSQNPKESVGEIWAKEFAGSEEKIFINIGDAVEGLARSGNSAQLDEIIFELTQILHKLRSEKKGKVQGYMSVGVLFGIFLGVLFI